MTLAELAPLVAGLKKTPIAVARLMEGLGPDQITIRPARGGFSLLENVCHLRDIEHEGYLVRVRRLLAEDRPHLADLDGDRLARERRYNEQPLREAYESFAIARRRTTEELARASEEDLARAGEMDGVGPITLGDLIHMMGRHDAEHLAAMDALRASLLASGR